MKVNYKKMKNLFLQQSYLDSWEDYERSLRKRSFLIWDYIVLTASNEEQASVYRQQIAYRLENHLLASRTKYVVLPDPDGKRVGSGGATFNVLKYIAEDSGEAEGNCFKDKRILVIHSGGDSKRVPQYSVCGKLFSPVPRELPNGRSSTLFDEFIIGMSGVPSRIKEGMLVLSGDVLLLFNPLQIDFQFRGAAAISIKEPVETGKNHGVFLNDGHDFVEQFLHKQPEEALKARGAVNEQGCVDLDTGAVVMDSGLLQSLFSLISTENKVDEKKFREFVNEQARISFYGDFLYPLANKATLEAYYQENPEGEFCGELKACREKIWNAIHEYQLKLLCLSPAEFIHFGTTRELLNLVTTGIDDYEFLGWKRVVVSNVEPQASFSVNNGYVEDGASVGANTYIENSYVKKSAVVGAGSVISCVVLEDVQVPPATVLHGVDMGESSYVVRIYGVKDNPKGTLQENAMFLGNGLKEFMEVNGLKKEDVWENEETYLWFANLYPICKTEKEALDAAVTLYRMARGTASAEEIRKWTRSNRSSLYSSFNHADVKKLVPWKQELENKIRVEKFIRSIENGMYYEKALELFGKVGINEIQFHMLMKRAESACFATKIRVYYGLSRYMKKNRCEFGGNTYDKIESLSFRTIQETIFENAAKRIVGNEDYRIEREEINVKLPVRVNWGGGWTDTPPHCNEKGGAVLNAAIKLNGGYPVQVTVRKLNELHVEFESQDVGVFGVAETAEEIQECHNPYDSFALHKAALIACGIIPISGTCDLKEILRKLGGGIYLSTQVVGVPKGSGLGTSSILSGACVKGLFGLLERDIPDDALYDIVLCMEQIMSTGGGWQDQVGGLTPGIKFITADPGIDQILRVEHMELRPEVMEELQERFALIYTGQRRLARNLLRDVVGGYLGARPESVQALHEIARLAVLMKFELERGNIDEFAQLLNRHWELSKQLDQGSTNTCIDQIFMACEGLIDGKFISGAGGGGFLQVILKKGITKDMLSSRLHGIFQDSGVDVWDCELI